MALLSLVSSSELKPGEFKTKINSRILKPLMWQEVEKQDERFRSQFKKIKAGMPPTEVRDLMGVGPQIKRDDFWGFKLSQASNTLTEINITLQVFLKKAKYPKQTPHTLVSTGYPIGNLELSCDTTRPV